MSHSTASVASQSKCWSTACWEIPTSQPLGMMLGGVWENADIIPSKVPLPTGVSGPHLICGSFGPLKFTSQMASRSVQPFLQDSQSSAYNLGPYLCMCSRDNN